MIEFEFAYYFSCDCYLIVCCCFHSFSPSLLSKYLYIVNEKHAGTRISSITTAILKIPDFVIDVVYILSVRKMILLTEDPE